MVARWVLLVVALLQGIVAFSPIPTNELEAEWEAFSATLRDPAYRLPTTTTPSRYAVSLTPYFEDVPAGVTPFTFDGTVTIQIRVAAVSTNQIVMHCQDLTISSLMVTTLVSGQEVEVETTGGLPTCEMPYAFLRITTQDMLRSYQVYNVHIAFSGIIQSGMRGFYRSWYRDTTGKRWMGTTQFQPGHARQAFPCYDEPGFKAQFDITINREADFSPSISNMPIATTQILPSGRVSETFHTTPLTSTYLLAFIVSHYEVVSTSTSNAARPFEIYARNNAGTTGDWSLEIGELLLAEMERYTSYPYYSMFPNMNMKQAAIPDFSAGAMENWGLLTYREALILYDPENSNHFYKQRVANIVSHEIAHMWFGNLVTCAWWDNLWLNEGFARFYQYYLTNAVAEELGYATRFIVEQVQTALFSDSVDTAHALTNPDVNNPTEVSNHFSTITYAKGAAVLRMTQHLLGEETFVAGLRRYIQDRAFNVAEPDHLFRALAAVSSAAGALDAYPGITVDGYFRTWSEKAGHPLLTVVVNHVTGAITVVQTRWERNTGVSSQPSLWQVPITWTRGGAPDFEDLKPSRVLTDQITVLNRGTTGLEWVIFNKQESGFYRVNYDRNNWALITRALRTNERPVIHELNRAQIVDDVFAFARAGVMDYARALNIISFLEFEDQYAPWIAAISGFEFLIRRTVHDAEYSQELKNEIIRLSAAVTNRLGYADVDSDTFMDGLLRMYVMEFLCNIGHEQCVQNAVTNFQNWRTNGTYIHPNMRSWVFCAGLREGSVEDFNYLWEYHINVDVASDRLVMLQSLGCTRQQASLEFLMSQIVTDNEYIRPQDYTTAMSYAVTGNEENTQIIWNWLKTGNNLANANTAFGSAFTPLSYIAARLITEPEVIEFETWLAANQEVIGTAAYASLSSSAQASRDNLAWSAQRVPEMRFYLDVGFVDDVVELPIETPVEPDPPTTEAPATGAPGGSSYLANIFGLSIITLFVFIIVYVAQNLYRKSKSIPEPLTSFPENVEKSETGWKKNWS